MAKKMTEFQRLRGEYKKKYKKFPPPGTSTADLQAEFGGKKTRKKTTSRRKSSGSKSTKSTGLDWTFHAWSK